MAVKTYHRIEKCRAVQYLGNDHESTATIRAWVGMEPDEMISTNIPEGIWVVRRINDGSVYLVDHENFIQDFQEVLEQ